MSGAYPAGECLAFFSHALDHMERLGGQDDERINAMMNVLLAEAARTIGTMLSHSCMAQEARDEFVRQLDDALTAPA